MREVKEVVTPDRPTPLWRNRDYILLWSGQTISNIGSGVSQLAFPLLVLALTNSPAQAGITGALRGLPYFIFTLPGGAMTLSTLYFIQKPPSLPLSILIHL